MCTYILLKEYFNGGTIELMNGHKTQSDCRDLLRISILSAIQGNNVKIMTPVHIKDVKYAKLYGSLLNTKYQGKCPDLMINGLFYEYESYSGEFNKNKVSNMLSKGLKQSNRIIINNEYATEKYIQRIIKDRIIQGQEISEILQFNGREIITLYKKQ